MSKKTARKYAELQKTSEVEKPLLDQFQTGEWNFFLFTFVLSLWSCSIEGSCETGVEIFTNPFWHSGRASLRLSHVAGSYWYTWSSYSISAPIWSSSSHSVKDKTSAWHIPELSAAPGQRPERKTMSSTKSLHIYKFARNQKTFEKKVVISNISQAVSSPPSPPGLASAAGVTDTSLRWFSPTFQT